MKFLKQIILFSILGLFFSGCGGNTITGKVVIKGQLPHTYVAIKVERRRYYHIVGKLKRVLLAHYQGDTVTLAGRVIRDAIGLGVPAHFEATKIVDFKRR